MGQKRTNENFDVDDILASLEADRKSGVLKDIVTKSAVRYGVDPDNPERLVAVDADGKRVSPPFHEQD